MAQPLIKFFRVASLPTTGGVPGALYFVSGEGVLYVCTGTSSFEAYSGARDASLNGELLTIVDRSGNNVEVNLANYVKKEQTIAGIDLKDSITAEELKTALGLTADNLAGEANVLESVKVNGETLNITDKAVNIIVAEGSADGTIAVNGENVAVHGLGSAAYTDADAYDAAGAAATAESNAKKYTDDTKDAIIGDATEAGNTLGKLEDKIQAVEAAAVSVNEDTINHVKVTKTGTEYTVEGVDIASAQDLADEIKRAGDEEVRIAGLVTAEADRATKAEEALDGRLDVIEGEGEGSIKKAVADAKTELIGDATTSGNTLGKLEDRIETIVANKKTYSIAKVESGLDENVKEAYKLVDEDGTQVGETINIYKDSSLISVELADANAEGVAGQYIKYTYVLANGTESVQYVDVSRLLVEAEFKNGLEVSAAGEVSVKRDADSEAFLSVSEAGVKLSGVQTAINTAAAKATTVVVEGTDAGNNLSIAKTVGEDGHSIYTVNLTDIASAQALSTLNTEVQQHEEIVAAALVNLNDRIDAVSNSIPTELGVMSVSEGIDGNFVTTTVDNADAANPKVSVAVDYVDGATAGDKLTTNTYVDEHIAAAINAIPAAHVTDVVGDSASYSVVEAPEAGGVHTVKNTLATITVDDNNKATVTEGLATDAFVKTYVENQLSWASF